mmetsp:Transcript_53945/g.115860  ORF Transcript_53945/g.115860 Transcript_53945/m.115860 type:complete len:245 (+) Transcript_53945:617-1351(+)
MHFRRADLLMQLAHDIQAVGEELSEIPLCSLLVVGVSDTQHRLANLATEVLHAGITHSLHGPEHSCLLHAVELDRFQGPAGIGVLHSKVLVDGLEPVRHMVTHQGSVLRIEAVLRHGHHVVRSYLDMCIAHEELASGHGRQCLRAGLRAGHSCTIGCGWRRFGAGHASSGADGNGDQTADGSYHSDAETVPAQARDRPLLIGARGGGVLPGSGTRVLDEWLCIIRTGGLEILLCCLLPVLLHLA